VSHVLSGTFSFQAPSLYRALGYRVELELSGFSAGIRKYTMVRHVADVEAEARR